MRKRNFKGRCVKRSVSKSQEVCRTYDAIQNAYLDVLEADDDIVNVKCDVSLDGTEYRDMTGNNINHPNDFLSRVYAQALLATLGADE